MKTRSRSSPSWSADQPRSSRNVPFAHTVRLCRIKRYVKDVNAVELRDALGRGRAAPRCQAQHRAPTSPVAEIEVQHLDEQRTNLTGPIRQPRRGEDAVQRDSSASSASSRFTNRHLARPVETEWPSSIAEA